MLVGAAMALPQSDLKRLLAYSTVSALGTLTLLLGLGGEPAIHAAMAFLLGHALYKGALFLVAGAIDHETGTRDVDVLGGLGREMPVTALAAGVAALSMAGLPPLMGFVAKELFYEATLHAPSAGVLSALAVLANGLIVAVALVVGIRPFLGELLPTPRKAHEAPASLWLGPIVLAGLSMICGLWSGLGAESLLSAASASTGQSAPMHLKLWHGLTPALGLSVVTLAGGLAIYALRGLARRTVSPWERASAWGPTGAYDLALAGLNALAKGQTRLLQSGYLRSYLLIILATTVALVGVALARNGRIVGLNDFSDVRFYEAGLGLLILLATVMAVVAKTRLAAIAALGVVGYGVALIFVLFGAPDVAMTQFLVETLTVILFVLVFYHLPESRGESHALGRTRDALMAAAVGITVTTLVLIANDVSFHPTISGYYFDHSFAEAHGRNVVNVILVDFRGLDTLGEITVLAVAGIGVYALLRLRLAPAVVPAAAADADGSPNLPARDGDAGKSDEAGSDANGKEDGR
jgi:multicomponent Na+:H+ antiporter subunit A